MNIHHKFVVALLGGVVAILSLRPTTALGQDNPQAAETIVEDTTIENQDRWEHFVPIVVPSAPDGGATTDVGNQPPLLDLVLGPSVFTHSRFDLADLRLYDKGGKTIPYALRYLRPQSQSERVAAEEFNRSEAENGAVEVTLDLKSDKIQHNAIEIITSSQNFRRLAVVEGSDDAKIWRPLATGHLVNYAADQMQDDQKIDLRTIEYSPSRFQYVRVRISPDPERITDNQTADDFRVELHILQHVEIPGEYLMLDAELGEREPTRSFRAPGSAWIIDLGGQRVPCDRIEVDIADAEFARDFQIQYEEPREVGGRVEFTYLSLNKTFWQRKAGEPKQPMVAHFGEVQTGRLQLIVTDHRNPPLSLRSVKFGAPVRQLVFPRPPGEPSDLQLYFGNPQAEPPNYDFARNLPLALPVPPTRATYGQAQQNPNFVPPPKAFTERFPWLIYVVLSSVGVILAIVIISLARTAITIHDTQTAAAQ